MGKDKKKNQKKSTTAAAAEIQQPVQNITTEVKQETQTEQFEMPPEIIKTPQERAEEYDLQQRQAYQQVIDGFKADELMLQSEADFSQKILELEKWRAVEMKKHEKSNKFILDFDDQFGQCKNEKQLQQLQERALKTLKEICAKTQKKAASTQLSLQMQKGQIDDMKSEIEANIKKRKTLQTMSELLLKKNCDLYLKHELMLDEERQRRVELGASFQQRMALIQEQLSKEKDVRAGQMQENTELRDKIQQEITKYNVKEASYQTQMKAYQTQMLQIEQKFKNQIEGTIQKQLTVAKDAKDKYDHAVSSCETLAGQIKGVVDKFDEIKVEINASSKKMEDFKQEVEMKQMEIKLLETEIENQNLLLNKKAALQAEIDGEGAKLKKQVETLSNLKKALEVQLANS